MRKQLLLIVFTLLVGVTQVMAQDGGDKESPPPVAATVLLANDSQVPRDEVVRVSVPFPQGKQRDLKGLIVKDRRTAWRVLCRWPDQSVRVGQAQFPLRLKPGQIVNLPVIPGAADLSPFKPHPWVAGVNLAAGLITEVTDIDGVPYYCGFAGQGEVLSATALVKTTRYRGYHRNPDPNVGIGRDFLSLTTYVTQFATSPVVAFDFVLGNDYLGADHPGKSKDPNLRALGDVRIGHFDLVSFSLPINVAFARQSNMAAPFTGKDQRVHWPLLKDTYLADGTCKRWRVYAFVDQPGGLFADRAVHRRTWQAMCMQPLRALCDAPSWLASEALSLYGGPACPPWDWPRRVSTARAAWQSRDHFGPFGSWGDIKETGTTGTPRNTPCSASWVNAIQTSQGRLLDILVGQAWQQTCRPCYMWGLKVEPEDDIYLWTGIPYSVFGGRLLSGENLGRKALHDQDPWAHWRAGIKHPWPGPHGWNGYDNEHWTTDLLFDTWIATGDWRCRDELALLGECAMGLLRPKKYPTQWPQAARGEGWMAHSLVQVYLATGDERVASFLRHRIREILVPAIKHKQLWKTPFTQGNYGGTRYPGEHRFYMPWQHGPLILGMLAAWRYLGEEKALELCVAAAQAVDYARVRDVQHAKFGQVKEGLRYYVPVSAGGKDVGADHFDREPGIHFGDSPLGGAHAFLTLPLYLLGREERVDGETQRIAKEVGELLLKAHRYGDNGRWRKWTNLIPD